MKFCPIPPKYHEHSVFDKILFGLINPRYSTGGHCQLSEMTYNIDVGGGGGWGVNDMTIRNPPD